VRKQKKAGIWCGGALAWCAADACDRVVRHRVLRRAARKTQSRQTLICHREPPLLPTFCSDFFFPPSQPLSAHEYCSCFLFLACCMSHVACCVLQLHIACCALRVASSSCMLHVACRMSIFSNFVNPANRNSHAAIAPATVVAVVTVAALPLSLSLWASLPRCHCRVVDDAAAAAAEANVADCPCMTHARRCTFAPSCKASS
jgi:hypothetical protein